MAAALVCLAVLLYWPATAHDFVNYDDGEYVTENPQVRAGLSASGLLWASTAIVGGNWHPLTLVSHMLDCELFGLRPAGHHLVSLLLHALNGALLFLVLWRMTSALWPSTLVAALFLVHPLNVQSVAWIAERKNLLSTLFWLLALWAYTDYARRGGRRRYRAVAIFFTLGLLSKPMLVTLPFVLLLLDFWPLARIAGAPAPAQARGLADAWGRIRAHVTVNKGLLLEKLPLLLGSAAFSLVALEAQRAGSTLLTLTTIPFGARLANAVVAYGWYVEKLFWPVDLAAFYPHPQTSLSWVRVASTLVFLIAVTVAVARTARQCRYLLTGWLWYLGTLVPVIGLVQVGAQAVADRYAYVPLIGLFVMIAWGAADLLRGRAEKRILAACLAAGALLLLMADTRLQLRPWRDGLTLFTHALKVTQNNFLAYNNLGTALYRQGRRSEALAHYARAAEINPGFVEAQFNLAAVLIDRGEFERAVERLNVVLRLDPGYVRALNNLGVCYIKLGRFEDAIPPLERALALQPDFVDAERNLGVAMLSSGR